MNDMIIKAAQDPSCVLAVTPDRGGSWWAALRPDTPRNFAEEPTAFYDCQSICGEKIDPSHDYRFLFDSEIVSDKIECSMFYAGAAGFPFGIYCHPTNQINCYTNLFRFSSSPSSQYTNTSVYNGESRLQGRHVIEMEIAGNSLKTYLDGVLINMPSGFARTGVATCDLPQCNSGYVYKIQIEDLTAGETVWQASHDELFETNNPWPSTTLRDFGNAPQMWEDFNLIQAAADLTHDYTFEIVFSNLPQLEKSNFYANAANALFGIYQFGTGQLAIFSNLLKDTSMPRNYISYSLNNAGSFLSGEHRAKMVVAGSTAKVFLDNSLVSEISGANIVRNAATEFRTPLSNGGSISLAMLTDDTTGKRLWNYPSEAERVGLLTKTNVRTDRGVFEAADTSARWNVKTPLRWQNLTAATIMARATVGDFPETVFSFGMPANPNYSVILLRRSEENQLYASLLGTRTDGTSVYRTITVDFSPDAGRQYCFALVFDIDGDFMNLYVDGSLLSSIALRPLVAIAVGGQTPPGFMLGTTSLSDAINSGTAVSSALVFDRALTAAEIAALTPKNQPLSWAGIRDVVRRGRAQRYFAVGDVLTVATPRWTIEYEVVGFDQVEPADAALTHSMTLLPVNLITELQFDAPEPENPNLNRSEHGCNRWDWSAVRQWLNSAAAPGEWWTAQHEYDAAPDYAATMAGFMADLPADFLSAVAPARLTTALPNADGGGSVETVDRFWLPSRTEIFGDANNGVAEGVLMTKYIDATDADRIKYNAAGNPASWYLRSAYTSQTHYVAFAGATGIYSTSFLVKWRVAAACIIA